MKKSIGIFIGILLAIGLIGCGIRRVEPAAQGEINEPAAEIQNETDAPETTTQPEVQKNSFGSTILFDDLEITFGSDYHFETIWNEFSDYNGQSVVVLPVTVTNLKNENHSLNMFYYTIFGSQGKELDTISTYFMFEGASVVDFEGELRPGASYNSNFYFLYDGDGTYYIEFDNWTSKVEAEFDIVMQ